MAGAGIGLPIIVTPAWNGPSPYSDPSVLPDPPSKSRTVSPRYQTLPFLSWAYHSVAISMSLPSSVLRSRRAWAVMPAKLRVSPVATTSLDEVAPSLSLPR